MKSFNSFKPESSLLIEASQLLKSLPKAFITNSATNNFIFGFKIYGIKYIIRVQKIVSTDFKFRNLWELKIANLHYSRDLKEHSELQASVEQPNLRLYLEIIDFVLGKLKYDRPEIHGLLINLPEQLKNREPFYKHMMILVKNHLKLYYGEKSENNVINSNAANEDLNKLNWFIFFKNLDEKRKIFSDDNWEQEINELLSNHSKIPLKTLQPVLPTSNAWYPEVTEESKVNDDEDDFEPVAMEMNDKEAFIAIFDEFNSIPYFNLNYNFILNKQEFKNAIYKYKLKYVSLPDDIKYMDIFLNVYYVFHLILNKIELDNVIPIILALNNEEIDQIKNGGKYFVNWMINYYKEIVPNYNKKELQETFDFKQLKNPLRFKFDIRYPFFKNKTFIEEILFDTLIRDFLKDIDFQYSKFKNLEFKDKKELNHIKTQLEEYDFSKFINKECDYESIVYFKTWVLNFCSDATFATKLDIINGQYEQIFSTDKKDNSESDLSKFKPYYQYYISAKTSSNKLDINNLLTAMPETTKEEKIDFYKQLIDYFDSKFIKDSIPESELEVIENKFKDVLNPQSTNFNEMKSVYADLEDYFDTIYMNDKFSASFLKYTTSSYNTFNNFFRTKGINHSELEYSVLFNLLEAFYHVPSQKNPLILLRGSKTDAWLSKKVAGDYVIETGFLSTSLDRYSALNFTSEEYGIMYIIYLPKSAKGIYIAPISEYETECEFLLPPGSVFRILSIENGNTSELKFLQAYNKTKKNIGLIYKLLYVGSVTKSLTDNIIETIKEKNTSLDNNINNFISKWTEFSKDITLKEIPNDVDKEGDIIEDDLE